MMYNSFPSSAVDLSMVGFSCIVSLQVLMVAYASNSITWINHFVLWGTLLFFFFICSVYGLVIPGELYHVFTSQLIHFPFWFALCVIVTFSLIPYIAVKYYIANFHGSFVHKM